MRFPSIFPIGVGSTTFPVSFPHAKTASPLLKMIDLISTSLVRSGFIRMLCVDKMNPSTLPLIFPLRFMLSFAPSGLNSLMMTAVVFSFPSKSSSFSKNGFT